jgi:serine/threonine protein kinase
MGELGKCKCLGKRKRLGKCKCFSTPYEQKELKKLCDAVCYEKSQPNTKMQQPFRKVFAILVLIDRTEDFPLFIREDLGDKALPLQIFPKDKSFYAESLEVAGPSYGCFKRWPRRKVDDFDRFQWAMLAPIFEKGGYNNVPHRDLRNETRLPFLDTHDRDEERREGGFSIVRMTQIHPSHHQFDDPDYPNPEFAIKELLGQNEEAFKKEVGVLQKFTGENKHKHIVTLLGTYKRFSHYNLIFYRADCPLSDYWITINRAPELDLKTVRWLAEQCEGLVDGLSLLHKHDTFTKDGNHQIQQYGRHNDIKPDNILWYKGNPNGMGTLKLSDFGSSALRSEWSRSNSKGSEADTTTYRAPERYIPYVPIRQTADTWSLGCVFLELVTWALGGVDLLDNLGLARTCCAAGSTRFPGDPFFHVEKLPLQSGEIKVSFKVNESVTNVGYYRPLRFLVVTTADTI